MRARPLHPGAARGRALVLAEPLSLWGGLDPASGEVVDPHHPQRGANLAARRVEAAPQRERLRQHQRPTTGCPRVERASGEVVDPHHPQRGANLAGRVLVLPAARGSSSSSSVLAEAARAGVAPAAILLGEPDLILAVGATVAEELYGVVIPVAVLAPEVLAGIADGDEVGIGPDGEVAL